VEHEQAFTVAAVLPMEDLAADPDLMPDFPGITGSASCREFDAPVPIDFDRIDDSDNVYWMEHRGTPKGFLRLERGRELWSNRYGATTQLRFLDADDTLASVREELRRTLTPRDLGLFALDVRDRSLGSVNKSVDLGEYFLGMSSFLIGAALLLTVLLFAFAMEQRRREFGLLLALGFTQTRTRRQFLKEAMLVAAGGAVLGTGLGIGYTWLLTDWISSGVWQAAVGGVQLEFAITPTRVLLGALGVWVLAVLVLDRSLRRLARQQAVTLLRGRAGAGAVHRRAPAWVLHLGWILALVGLALALIGEPDPAAAMRFFGSGAALLVGGICLAIWWLRRLGERRPERQRGLGGLSLANAARRPGRSLTVVAVLASAAFLTLAVGAMYRDASFNRWERRSGTGGFAFMGHSSLPVLHDLDSEEGRKEYGITASRFERWARSREQFDVEFAENEDPFAGLGFVQIRSTEGDDASCLNLNRSQQPRLWGVDSTELAERGAFSFGAVIDDSATEPQRAWRLLQQRRTVSVERGGKTVQVQAVPAIAESNAATYAMGIGIGDTITYTDEAGYELVVVLVGTVTNAMLQGGLLIEEDLFVDHFPSRSGYTTFLVDYGHHGSDELAALAAYFERRLQDVGLELNSAAERLEQLYAMQNVYLGIFQILGALGLLLGSMGLGVILMRNVVERQQEFALMRAVGFRARRLSWMLILEHSGLLLAGLCIGLVSAVVAILPIVLAPGRPMAVDTIGLLLAVVLAVGLLTIVLAGRWAMSRRLVQGLRAE
ncbi:MAG: FtsX-like permease family protein, partial [Planctomycetota bacterium]